MSKLLSIIILSLLINNPLNAKVNTKNLNEFYNGCLDNAKRKNQYEGGVKTLKPKNKKLAAMYGDKNKITRGDIITAAKKNKGTA